MDHCDTTSAMKYRDEALRLDRTGRITRPVLPLRSAVAQDCTGTRVISTRRLAARPASVSFEATAAAGP